MNVDSLPREIQINILKHCGLEAQLAMGIFPKDISIFARFKNNQARDLSRLLKFLSSILIDATVRFETDSFNITEMDAAMVCLINMTIPKTSCSEYYCPHQQKFSLNFNELYRIVQSLSAKSELILWKCDKDSNLTVMTRQKASGGIFRESVHKLIGLDLDDRKLSVNFLQEFDYHIELPVDEFAQIFKNQKTVKIVAKPNQLVFRFDQPQAEIRFSHDKSGAAVVAGEFSARYLLSFSKVKSLSKTVIIKLKDNFPLLLTCNINGLGTIDFAVAPTQ